MRKTKKDKLAKYNPKGERFVYKIIMISLAVIGLYFPIGLWILAKVGETKTPFQQHAFSPGIENTVTGMLAVLALGTAFAMWKKSSYAIYLGITLFSLNALRQVVETIMTYDSVKYYPGPKYASISGAVMMVLAAFILGWYYLLQYPRTIKQLLDKEKR